ncbi:MAG: hypothetical protein ACM3X1_02970 [Ignavibacteriales bacterium]
MSSNEAQTTAQSYYERVQFFNQVAGNQAAWTTILSNLFHENNPFPNDQLENKESQAKLSIINT